MDMMEMSKALWCLLIGLYFLLCVTDTHISSGVRWWQWPGLIIIFGLLAAGGLGAVGFGLYALAYPLIQWLTPIILPLITPQ